jgi:hypothetical protein
MTSLVITNTVGKDDAFYTIIEKNASGNANVRIVRVVILSHVPCFCGEEYSVFPLNLYMLHITL